MRKKRRLTKKGEEYLVEHLTSTNHANRSKKGNNRTYRNWWMVSADARNVPVINVGLVTFPPEFLGKKVSIKVTLLSDKNT